MTKRGYRKEDVERHSIGFSGRMLPAVNIKVQVPWSDSEWQAIIDKGGSEFDGMSVEALTAILEDDANDWLFGAACETNWEMIEEIAADIFDNVKVWKEGRSGGWAVVEGLPSLDEWDAVVLGRWHSFEKRARSIAADVPYQMAWLAYNNVFEPKQEEEKRIEAQRQADLCRTVAMVAVFG